MQEYPATKEGSLMGKIIAACGNDCAACPRYTIPPYEKTDEELDPQINGERISIFATLRQFGRFEVNEG